MSRFSTDIDSPHNACHYKPHCLAIREENERLREKEIWLDGIENERNELRTKNEQLKAQIEMLSTPHTDALDAQRIKDAARYRWLRKQHWNYSDLVVVTRPRQNVKLGSDMPFEERLDEAIDAAMKGGE